MYKLSCSFSGTRVDTGTFTRPKKGNDTKRRLDYANHIDLHEPVMPKPISTEELKGDSGMQHSVFVLTKRSLYLYNFTDR